MESPCAGPGEVRYPGNLIGEIRGGVLMVALIPTAALPVALS